MSKWACWRSDADEAFYFVHALNLRAAIHAARAEKFGYVVRLVCAMRVP